MTSSCDESSLRLEALILTALNPEDQTSTTYFITDYEFLYLINAYDILPN